MAKKIKKLTHGPGSPLFEERGWAESDDMRKKKKPKALALAWIFQTNGDLVFNLGIRGLIILNNSMFDNQYSMKNTQ